MSDTDTSSAPASAPAATAGTTPPMASPVATQPFGTFGSTRGSGLARGKRPSPAGAPPVGAAAPGGYTPSALEVIRPQSEYKNPFTGETSVGAPVVNEPAPQAAPLETPVAFQPSAPVAKPAPVTAPAPSPARAAPTGELFPFTPGGSAEPASAASASPAEKPELKILPPAETKRPATNWEATGPSAADDRRNERPTFRPERRESKPFEPREGKPFEAREPKPFAPREPKPFAPREPRRDNRPGDSRSGGNPNFGSGQTQQPHAPRAPRANTEEPKPSGGFFAWLKGLFGGKPAEPAPNARTDGDQRRERDGDFNRDGQRRRHRGGRGRGGFQGENRGPRDGQSYQPRDPRDEAGPSASEGGERHFDSGGGQGEYREGGGGRRRRRGGRGRFRGEGGGGGEGDRRNDPNPEGQQGGGAI
jgi:hypothetical protein